MKDYKKMWEELENFIEHKKTYYKNINNTKLLHYVMKKNDINKRIIILNTISQEMKNLEREE